MGIFRMKISYPVAALLALGWIAAATADPNVSGPNDRQVTDSKSVVSVANPNVKPVPVEDLYVTR